MPKKVNKFTPGCCCGCTCCQNCNTPQAWVFTIPPNLFLSGRSCTDEQCTSLNGVEIIMKRMLPLEGIIPCCDAHDIDCNFGGDSRDCSWYYPVPDHGRQIYCNAFNPDCDDGVCNIHAWMTMDTCIGGNTQLNLFFGCTGPWVGGPCDGNLSGGDGVTWFGPPIANCCDPQLFFLTGASLFLRCDCIPTLPVDSICSCVFDEVTDICVRPYHMDNYCKCQGCDDAVSQTCIWSWDTSGIIAGESPCAQAEECTIPFTFNLAKTDACTYSLTEGSLNVSVLIANTVSGDCSDMTTNTPICDTTVGAETYDVFTCTIKATITNDCYTATYCGNGLTCDPIQCNFVSGSQSCCDPGDPIDAANGCAGLPSFIILTW